MDDIVLEKAEKWAAPPFDADTKEKTRALINGNPSDLNEAFYKGLEFGTGGLRGIMGVGPAASSAS